MDFPPRLPTAPRKILVIHVTRIGDTLLATPALRAIAAAYPQASITCLAHPKRAEVLRHLPFLARVGTIEKRRALWLGHWPGRAYDLAFVYGYDKALVRYALRVAQRVVAFRQNDAALDARLSPAVPPPPTGQHAVSAFLALPAALGIPPAGRRLAYQVTEAEAHWARRFLATHLASDAGPLIGLQVASFPTKAWRDWPIEHFQALCQKILARWPRSHFLIFGGRVERERTRRLHRTFENHATLLAGKVSLRQTAALMSELDLYIGVDTGPTHLMSCFDIPLIALYHCQSPSRIYGPLEHPALHAIDHPQLETGGSLDCSMAEIDVERVWREVCAVLDGF